MGNRTRGVILGTLGQLQKSISFDECNCNKTFYDGVKHGIKLSKKAIENIPKEELVDGAAAHTNAWDKEEVWAAIHKLSDIRAGFSVFAREERSVYNACSLAIKALREVIGE